MKAYLVLTTLLSAALAVPRFSHQKNTNEDSTVPPIAPRNNLGCGTHVLADGSYTIESPNHPSNYGNNYDCQYQVSAANGGSIAFSCSAFVLEANSNCAWDWLQVNGQKYCGTNAPPASSGASFDIQFHSDYSVVRTGFRCTLTVTGGSGGSAPLQCGTQTLSLGTHTIESPNHPNNYGNNYDCQYQLTAASGATISFSCSAFSLEANSNCAWDWLQVNGQKYCGTNAPPASSGSSFNIEFHSDYSVVNTGFRCTLEVTEGGVTTTTAPPSGSCCCGTPNRASRIVGGQATEVYEYPWMAGIVSSGGTRTWCGGAIINSMYVLSAAHCFQNTAASSIQVLIKEHLINNNDGQIRKDVQSILNHPSYTSVSGSGYDFSLLKMTQAIQFPADNTVAPACLPTASNMFVGADAVVTGWGRTVEGGSQATTLQEVTVPVISNSQCSESYSSINPTMICAGLPEGGKDACQGDSGGPMVSIENDRYALIGVVSWGSGCARPGYPGVYARVTYVLPWIQENSADGQFCS